MIQDDPWADYDPNVDDEDTREYVPRILPPDPGLPSVRPTWPQDAVNEGRNPFPPAGGQNLTAGMSEETGRRYDAERGLVGGYMGANGWVSGEPRSGGGGGGGSFGLSGGSFDSSGFSWPRFNAPQYTAGAAFQGPATPFAFEAFKGPGAADIFKDPSYTGRRDEGLRAIEHGAAAKGLTRLPQTLKALGSWNQDFASREYGNIFDRSAQTWGMNRNNAADAYSLNYGVSRDVWDRGEQQNLSTHDRNYKGAYDMFDMNELQPAKMTFEDMFRRYKAELDSTTQIAGYGD